EVVTGSGLHHVIILDASYSMLAGPNQARRWDLSLKAARQLAASWGRGERFSVLRLGKEERWLAEGATVQSPEKTLELLKGLEVEEEAVATGGAILSVLAKFPSDRLEIFVFADDQASSWKDLNSELPEAGERARILWFCPPLESYENLAVTSVRFPYEKTLVGHSCRVYVKVRNFGSLPVKDSVLEILLGENVHGKLVYSLLANQESEFHYDLSFDKPGSYYVSARIPADLLEFDNRMSAGIEVREQFSALVLQDASEKAKFDSAWETLRIAQNMQEIKDVDDNAIFTAGQLQFFTKDENITQDEMSKFDAVLLDGGCKLTPGLAVNLARYVEQGGGLILGADEKIDAQAWNKYLGDHEILPAPLRKLRIEAIGGAGYQSLARSDFGPGAMRTFESDEDGDISRTKFYVWHTFDTPAEGAGVLARFSDRSPFLVAQRKDLGTVLLMAAALNGQGSNLTVSEFFMPILYRLVFEAASGSLFPRVVGREDPIRYVMRSPGSIKGVSFNAEGGPAVPANIFASKGLSLASVPAGLNHSGLCSFLLFEDNGRTSRIWYGVQGPRVDSSLLPVTESLKQSFMEKLGMKQVPGWEELERILMESRSGSEWHSILMLILLLLIAAEMAFQRTFI
ncbi:MAG: VWA domain-containing protein, partial [Planctomycetes bacterium]|nr:VWA domain-containing protein [Planctomycetota bacterium]